MIIVVLSFFNCRNLCAIPLKHSRPEYLVRRWGTEQRLPSNQVQSIGQSDDGYLWVGTNDGLVRFDGVRFVEVYDALVPQHMGVTAFARDRIDGGIWIGTTEGLFRYRDRKFERFGVAQGLPHRKVWRLFPARNGDLWMETEVGTARLKGGEITLFGGEQGLKQDGDRFQWAAEGPTGLVLLGRGIWRRKWDGELQRLENYDFPGLANSLYITAVRQSAKGEWLIGTDHGVVRGTEGHWENLGEEGMTDGWVNCLHEDAVNGIWLGARDSRLYRRGEAGWEEVDIDISPRRDGIKAIFNDAEDNLWIGTSEGLVCVRPRTVQVYARSDGLPTEDIHCLDEGRDGSLWVGTEVGIAVCKDGMVEPFADYPLFKAKAVHGIAAEGKGAAWLNLDYLARVTRSNEGKFVVSDLQVANWMGGLQAVHVDESGRVLLGTPTGIYEVKSGRVELLKRSTGAEGFFADRRGQLWFANGASVERADSAFSEVERPLLHRAPAKIHAVCEDSEGAFWIGTEKGLLRGGKAPFTYDTHRGLVEDRVNQVLDDGLGFLWLGGMRGIYRVSHTELKRVATGELDRAHPIRFSESDGMLMCETSDDFNSARKTRDGRLWFATRKGLAVINPESVRVSEKSPPVLIEDVLADGKSVLHDSGNPDHRLAAIAGSSADRSAVQIPPGKGRAIEVRFTANTFVAPERAIFKYKLDDYDHDWCYVRSEQRTAPYTNLRPGKYVFKVCACNSRGYWNDTGASLQLSILPTFTETTWFPVFCAAGVLGLGVGFVIWRLSWQRRALKAERLAALEQERARIARDLHDDLGSSLSGIALELEAAKTRGMVDGNQLPILAAETRELAHKVREHAWATNPRCDTTQSINTFLAELAERNCQSAGLSCRLDLPSGTGPSAVSASIRRELLIVAKECLVNIRKHARAKTVSLKLDVSDDFLEVSVIDDGIGFDTRERRGGSGLINLQERVEKLSGTFSVSSIPGHGTTIIARFPMP